MAKADIVPFDWGSNVDGGITLAGDPIRAGVDDSGFDFGTGLGSIALAISGAATRVAAAGQSWEIDEPGRAPGDQKEWLGILMPVFE